MKDTRKGFLTEQQEQISDDLIPLSGLAEKADGLAIRLADNKGLESLKPKLVEKYGEAVLEDVYDVIDIIFEPLAEIAKSMKEKKEK